ncbi:MAG: pantoate--beta-alanine ligase [Gammaproteobacteria bacterium]|nr:MAG: pantoate--beta-alanine ligase [Gammaproteobacteria bacterium]
MQTVTTVAELRQHINKWKNLGNKVVLVPTMGNLHAGHLTLMKHAHRCGDKVICSIFVNALQFDRSEDLKVYPRTPEQDLAALQVENVDLVFMPEHEEVYAAVHKPQQAIPKYPLNDQLCGKYRPGFFDGIAEVVARLFHMIRPDVAVFGEKDYQQLIIIKRLVQDMSFPILIEQVPTQREEDGLAYSSRNSYLNVNERAQAKQIHEALLEVKTQIESGSQDFAEIEKQAMSHLMKAGFQPDYVAIRNAKDMEPASYSTDFIVILVAAWLGKARLIDNLLLPKR